MNWNSLEDLLFAALQVAAALLILYVIGYGLHAFWETPWK